MIFRLKCMQKIQCKVYPVMFLQTGSIVCKKLIDFVCLPRVIRSITIKYIDNNKKVAMFQIKRCVTVAAILHFLGDRLEILLSVYSNTETYPNSVLFSYIYNDSVER